MKEKQEYRPIYIALCDALGKAESVLRSRQIASPCLFFIKIINDKSALFQSDSCTFLTSEKDLERKDPGVAPVIRLNTLQK